MSKNKIFTEEDILNTIKMFACSQGFYGRLLESLQEAKKEQPEAYKAFIKSVQNAGVKTALDLVYFLEC